MMDTTQTPTNTPETISHHSIGKDLRLAREAQGLSIGDVAQRTKFSVHQVEALEADELSHLPQGTFLRGFVRSYARVLMLDENALLARIPVHADLVKEMPSAGQAARKILPSGEVTRRNNIYLFAGALAIAILLVAFVWNYRDSPTLPTNVVEKIQLPALLEASAPVEAVESGVAATSADAATVEMVVADLPPTKSASITDGKNADSKLPDSNKVLQVQNEPGKNALNKSVAKKSETAVVAPSLAVPLVSGKPEVPLDMLKKRPIHIVFIEDAWMEIIDTNGDVLLSRMNSAGSEKWIGGGRRAPYEIAIGKVSAVRIYYKGHEVDLTHFDPSRVANLVLE